MVKLVTRDAGATWLPTELDPADPDLAFGLCDLDLGRPELGYVRPSQLETARGSMALKIERDHHFTADRTLSDYAADAQVRRRIRA